MSWISYAQNFEDVTLLRALRHLPTGFYIDVGAHDPTADSVTRAFYDRGWCGINIEPVAHWHDRLQAQRPRDVNLAVAAAAQSGAMTLHEVQGTGLSTLDADQAAAYAAEGLTVRAITVPTRTLDDICAEHATQREIHFLKIDAEGAEADVLRGLDLSRHRPWIIVVEATRPRSPEPNHQAWEPLVLQRGYQFAWFDGLNRYYLADERAALRPLLAQPPSVHDGWMRYTERFLRDDVADYAQLLAQAREQAAQAVEHAQQARRRVEWSEQRVAAILGSRSWRWMAPIRAVSAGIRMLFAARQQPSEQGRGPSTGSGPGPGAGIGADDGHLPAQGSASAPGARPASDSSPAPASVPARTPAPALTPAPTPELAAALAPALEPGLEPGLAPALSTATPSTFSPSESVPESESESTPALPPRRPRLALVTPWPPQPSGVADTVAALVPHLQQHFEVDVITTAPAQPVTGAMPPVALRTPQWFDAHAHLFDHICHHVGNALFHEPVLDLLPRHGGTVVVHDFLLSDCLWYLQRTAQRPHAWVQALYRSHGWHALVHIQRHGIESAVRRWPACLDLLRHADGLIFTSDYSRRWWLREIGLDAPASHPVAQGSTVVPLPLHGQVAPHLPAAPAQRSHARARLNIPDDAFLVATFGAADPSKYHDTLARIWPAVHADCQARGVEAQAVCIGAVADPTLDDELQRAGLQVTGHVSVEAWHDWLAAADVAVQLRRDSRGESSGALLQAMGAGLACVVSRHGPMADLPSHMVVHLEAAGLESTLPRVLLDLQADTSRRAALGQAAQAHVRLHHDPSHVALLQAEAIQRFARQSRRVRLQRTLVQVRTASPSAQDAVLTPHDEFGARADRAQSLERSDPPALRPTLWVDITAITVHDLGSGVQRVTRNVLRPLLERGVSGWRVEPVVLNHGRYWTCRAQTARRLGIRPDIVEGLPPDEPAPISAGDTWFGLDLVTDGVHQHEALFRAWKTQGVRIAFMVHDLLPLTHPHSFPPQAVAHFQGWWHTVARTADVLVCNSHATADEIRRWWAVQGADVPVPRPPVVEAFGLGADLDRAEASLNAQPDHAQPDDPQAVDPEAMTGGILMVGTLEPRKGIGEALTAMEARWARGAIEPLILVGRPGWMVEDLMQRLDRHPERGTRLQVLGHVSDDQLQALYRRSRLLLMASQAEGYGLPIVEALRHGLPVLARDIPVFREIAGDAADYWHQAADLPDAIDAALARAASLRDGSAPNFGIAQAPSTWAESVQRLLPLITDPTARLL